MPKLILRCNYLKKTPSSHLSNFMKYIATREGVEKINDTSRLLPATVPQKELIADILKKISDAKYMHEYIDYYLNPTRENASEFITQALENNMDMIAKKKNYIDYLANRPGVEKQGIHGLFSDLGKPVMLSQVMEEVADHKGIIWTNVISLRREDAERLGYDKGEQWRELIRSKLPMFCKNFKIKTTNLRWYAAFHNQSHHPHVHLVVYSSDQSEGYLTKAGINTMRSELAHDIFRQDFMNIYQQKTEKRDQLKEQAENSLLFLLEQIKRGVCYNKIIEEKMIILTKRLMKTSGKKVYGYLNADVKAIVDSIMDGLAKEDQVAACYEKWIECQNDVFRFYKDTMPERIPLSAQKELRSIKNVIIREAVRLGDEYIYMDDDMLPELERAEESLEEQKWEGESGREIFMITNISEEPEESIFHLAEQNPPDEISGNSNTDVYYAQWSAIYKEAKGYLYGTKDSEPDFEAAYEIMKEEAENGNALALYDVGKMYQQGIFVEPDEEAAQEWFAKSLTAFHYTENKKASAYLEYRIGKQYQFGFGTEADYAIAAGWFQEAAGKNHKYAQYSLALLYQHGKGVEQNYEKAFSLMKKSHEQGNAYASYELAKMYEGGIGTLQSNDYAEKCYRLAFLGFSKLENTSKDDSLLYRIGSMYLNGKGTEKDEQKAEQYFLKASQYGNVTARYQLAKMYLHQEVARQDEDPEYPIDYKKIHQAISWLEEAVLRENPFAAYALGNLYLEGNLIAKDMEKAIFYLTASAGQNNSYAQYKLGKIFLSEEYRDIPKALQYLISSADQNNSYAAYRLGRLFLLGEEVPKDMEKAVRYLIPSADSGNSFAQYILGKLYLMGKELPQDEEKGLKLLQMAAEQGNIYAAYLLEYWQNGMKPDLLLMATRLLHQLEQTFTDSIQKEKAGGSGITDRKQRRKMQEKKVLQGHAKDDREPQMQL